MKKGLYETINCFAVSMQHKGCTGNLVSILKSDLNQVLPFFYSRCIAHVLWKLYNNAGQSYGNSMAVALAPMGAKCKPQSSEDPSDIVCLKKYCKEGVM